MTTPGQENSQVPYQPQQPEAPAAPAYGAPVPPVTPDSVPPAAPAYGAPADPTPAAPAYGAPADVPPAAPAYGAPADVPPAAPAYGAPADPTPAAPAYGAQPTPAAPMSPAPAYGTPPAAPAYPVAQGFGAPAAAPYAASPYAAAPFGGPMGMPSVAPMPTWVNVSRIICYVWAGLAALGGVLLLIFTAIGSAALVGTGFAGYGIGIGFVLLIVMLAVAALYFFAAKGIGKGSNGWRIAVTVICGLGVLGSLTTISDNPGQSIFGILLEAAVIVGLWMPESQAWFKAIQSGQAVAP